MPPDRFPGPLWDVLSARVPGVRARVTQDLCVSVCVWVQCKQLNSHALRAWRQQQQQTQQARNEHENALNYYAT